MDSVSSPPLGPFITATLSTVLSSGLLVSLWVGMPLSLMTVLWVVLPVMTTATVLIAVSMGWIFVSIGRSKRQPRWVAGTAVMIAISMLELLVLTVLTEGRNS